MPHVFDILRVMAIFANKLHNSSSLPCENIDNVDVFSSNETCQFMSGIEAEAEIFARLNPKLFFITCRVLTDIKKGCFGSCANVSFPVIFKGGHYYILVGEEDTPVYRVHEPNKLFFTLEGKLILKHLLKKNKNWELEFYVDKYGKQSLYCIPSFTVDNAFPAGRWDGCSEDEINSMIPHPLVTRPKIPPTSKFSVQLVDIEDTENIVDIILAQNEQG
eukprot:CAMPEP_0201697508 /NCGR_PEP_ID=MMETSP0578-20130828/11354_1 /ASSEMBLY_ACC=CAM_ASM_000663 /TAXON_ID=267565 /ORGANISM="Skeletonema grethea, Strain CCMP 1804" /LENGTH=217 /DNA_ID=CAMNT_0048183695 /DNA_START=236 /DNA_END=889 /DNA_ORIENTATION=+